MKIFVKAKPNAKKEKVEKVNETHFIVSVKEPPAKGRANAAMIAALAGYFGINRHSLQITSGHTGKNKIVEISE